MTYIGVDLGGTNIRVGVLENNSLKNILIEKTKSQGTKEEIIQQIIDLIGKVFSSEVKGIGIGVPAVVDAEGIVYETNNIPSWDEVHLKDEIKKVYDIPVFINNDANCFALAEKHFGSGKEYSNMVGLITGTGVGAGIIIDGKLFAGEDGSAGEFGELPYLDKTFEDYCGGKFFLMKGTDGETAFERAGQGYQEDLNLFKEYGIHLTKLISVIISEAKPKIIVIGGSVSKAFEFYKDSIVTDITIVPSSLENAGILGAAGLCLNAD